MYYVHSWGRADECVFASVLCAALHKSPAVCFALCFAEKNGGRACSATEGLVERRLRLPRATTTTPRSGDFYARGCVSRRFDNIARKFSDSLLRELEGSGGIHIHACLFALRPLKIVYTRFWFMHVCARGELLIFRLSRSKVCWKYYCPMFEYEG